MNYRYTECGLDNVTIHNMPVVVDDEGDEVYSIPNILGLHKTIACCIIWHEHSVNGAEMRFLRTEMGLTQAELARIVKKDHQTIGRWERGETPIDENAEFLIRLLAAEMLEIDADIGVQDLADRCIPSAVFQEILIDAEDPNDYRPMAA